MGGCPHRARPPLPPFFLAGFSKRSPILRTNLNLQLLYVVFVLKYERGKYRVLFQLKYHPIVCKESLLLFSLISLSSTSLNLPSTTTSSSGVVQFKDLFDFEVNLTESRYTVDLECRKVSSTKLIGNNICFSQKFLFQNRSLKKCCDPIPCPKVPLNNVE